ncbi:MAG TPA: hypothetical protein VK154_02680 [Chitinophagales bacterium]|nr:hypothetical protein [Chitinophagales bacterium]
MPNPTIMLVLNAAALLFSLVTSFYGKLLLTFLGGIAVAYFNRQLQLFRELKENEAFINYWVNAIEDDVKKQAQSIKEFAERLRKLDGEPEPLATRNLHVDKLRAIPTPAMLRTFVTNKRGQLDFKHENFYAFTKNSDFLADLQIAKTQNVEVFVSMAKVYHLAWNESMGALNKWFRDVLKKEGENVDANVFLQDVFASYSVFSQRSKGVKPEDILPITWTKEFLEDISPKIDSYAQKDPFNLDLIELKGTLGKVNTAFNQKVVNYNSMAKSFDELAEKYEPAYADLKNAKNNLVGLKMTSFLLLR